MDNLEATVLAGTIRLAVCIIFLVGASYKFRNGDGFVSTLEAYRLLPRVSIPVFARLLPGFELAAGFLVIWPLEGPLAVAPAIVLLLITAVALGINLARGRSDLDCGCGGVRGRGISPLLLLRNGGLATLLAASAIPLDPLRLAGALVLIVPAAIALVGFHFTASQLVVNTRLSREIA